MCMSTKVPKVEPPRLPVEYAAQRAPASQNIENAGNRTRDRLRAASTTMLTGMQGVGSVDASGKKVLLGA